jgi:gamma-glutamylcyclotransferase (GGCT)/AIG2-like uncharacterized protein YtfP
MDIPAEESTLFVYGSLRDAAHRAEIIGRPVAAIAAVIHDFERGRAGHFYLRRCPGVITDGELLLGLTAEEFAILDRYEDLPRLYTRDKIEVRVTDGSRVRCWVYLPTPFTLDGGK